MFALQIGSVTTLFPSGQLPTPENHPDHGLHGRRLDGHSISPDRSRILSSLPAAPASRAPSPPHLVPWPPVVADLALHLERIP